MVDSFVDEYKQHLVWEVLQLKHDALDAARFSNAGLERQRGAVRDALSYARKSVDNTTQPVVYLPALDHLLGLINQIGLDEAGFQNFANSQYPGLSAAVRDLPGPPPRNLPQSYVEVLTDAVHVRESELAELREQIDELKAEVAAQTETLTQHGELVEQQGAAVTSGAQTIQNTAEETAAALHQSHEEALKEWSETRDAKDKELNQQMADQVTLLTTAAMVGQRLIEHAASNLTALEWTRRATRERRSASRLRALAIVFGFAGLALAGFIVFKAVSEDFKLTLGDGLLRAAVVISVIAVGGYFGAESRRHFTEADTAEEVATAMTALEPFFAGASASDRAKARNAIGDTVFVRNMLSRFTSRDAGRHNERAGTQDLSGIIDELTKVVKASQVKNLEGSK